MVCHLRDGNSYCPKQKIVAMFQVHREHTTRIRARKTVTTIPHTRRITIVVCRARPPLLPPSLLHECALEPLTTWAGIAFRASLAHSATAIERATLVRRRRQHCRGVPLLVSENARIAVARLSNNAAQIAAVKRSRTLMPSADHSHAVVPAAGNSASIVVYYDGENARSQRRLPRSWSECGNANSPSSAVFLNRGVKSAMRVRAPKATLINHCTSACSLCALARHASRRNKAALAACPLLLGRCSPPPTP